MPVIRERSVVHPKWLKIRWGWIVTVGVLLLGTNKVFGDATFAMIVVLGFSYLMWRGDRDSGRG